MAEFPHFFTSILVSVYYYLELRLNQYEIYSEFKITFRYEKLVLWPSGFT